MDTKNDRVKFRGVTIHILKILPIIEETHLDLTGRGAVITSLNDGIHAPNSKHFDGNAVDLRIWYTNAKEVTNQWATSLAAAIGSDYDLLYGDPQHLDHIHIEYDPRQKGWATVAQAPLTCRRNYVVDGSHYLSKAACLA